MNIYQILRMLKSKAPWPVKILGLWGMHTFGRRTIGVFIDPVLACNLSCRMCYFSDPQRRKELHGTMTDEQLRKAQKALFHRALKLQIGCGAEPTLFSGLEDVVKLGKEAGVPYISLTTNGMLIASGKHSLERLVAAGLNEITLSMHGTTREIYENLMPGAKYDHLLKLIELISAVKAEHPGFIIRVNYTVNTLNKEDLRDNRFFDIWKHGCMPDIVQLRPVQKIGESSWTDFNLEPLIENYESTIGNVVEKCHEKGITCIAPTKENIEEVAEAQNGYEALLESHSYCYISPTSCYKGDFDLDKDTYESYHKRHRTARKLFKAVFRNPEDKGRNMTKKLNYKID